MKIIKSIGLSEINLGPWEGKTVEDVKTKNPEQYEYFKSRQDLFSLKGAETFAEVQKRVVSEVKKIIDNNEGKTMLAVSHGIAIKTAEIYFRNMQLSGLQDAKVLENGKFLIFRKENNEITVTDDISILP